MTIHAFFFSILLAITIASNGQHSHLDDYKIYSSIIRSETGDTTKSVAIIRRSIHSEEVHEHTSNIATTLRSGNENSLQRLYAWTESEHGSQPTPIDTSAQRMILDFCGMITEGQAFQDRLDLHFESFFLTRYPIRNESVDEDWNEFYRKYPGSGGIFSFSRVAYYSPDWKTAVVYFWHRRYGLNGHGALAVMKKAGDAWLIKYKTYLWWN